jgi:hypothetical protein
LNLNPPPLFFFPISSTDIFQTFPNQLSAGKIRRWRPLAELAEAVALLQLGRAEEVKDVKDEMPGESLWL